MATLDLNPLTEDGRVHNLTGRDLGRRARENLGLSDLDAGVDSVEVLVPDHVYLITPSFFIGMFAKSVSFHGSVEAFFDKYQFTSPPQVLRQIQDSARRAYLVTRPRN
jgi:hypothetical protein